MEKTDPVFYVEIERGIVLWVVKDKSSPFLSLQA